MKQGNVIVKNLTLAETIANRVPEKAIELLVENGYPKQGYNRQQITNSLTHFINTKKDEAVSKIMAIHPDVQWYKASGEDEDMNAAGGGRNKSFRKKTSSQEHLNCCGHADGEYSNCSGCSGKCGGAGYSNCSGGCCDCGPGGMAGGRGRYSNAAGDETKAAAVQSLISREMMPVIAVISIIAFASIVVVSLNKSNNKGA